MKVHPDQGEVDFTALLFIGVIALLTVPVHMHNKLLYTV